MAIFTTLSVVKIAINWFSTGTPGILATLVYAFTMRVVIYDILSMATITTLSTSILFCNLYYILLRISPRYVNTHEKNWYTVWRFLPYCMVITDHQYLFPVLRQYCLILPVLARYRAYCKFLLELCISNKKGIKSKHEMINTTGIFVMVIERHSKPTTNWGLH